MIRKPPTRGAPCNGCGECCRAEICPAGEAVYGPGKDCPGLLQVGKVHLCKLILAEQQSGLEPHLARALNIGGGCHAGFFEGQQP
jgi:hypothetical protein